MDAQNRKMLSKKSMAVLMWATTLSWAYAQPGTGNGYRYPLDYAKHLVTKQDVGTLAGQDGVPEDADSAPVLKSRPLPLGGLSVAPNTSAFEVKDQSNWVMPPFPGLDPAPPRDAPEAVKKYYRQRLNEEFEVKATGFADLPVNLDTPSAYLKPRSVMVKQTLRSQDLLLRKPFSSVRFRVDGRGFVQLSLYGGTTSFAAEEAYQALRNCVDGKNKFEGLGKDAFYASYKEPPEGAQAPVVVGPGMPFHGLEVTGQPHPDWVDPNLQMAHRAPAFQDIAVPRTKLEGSLLPPKPKQYARSMPEYNVLVAYFPDKAITVELEMDSRMGALQDVIRLALAVTSRILQF